MPNFGPLSPQQGINADLLGRLVVAPATTVPGFLCVIPVLLTGSVTLDVDVIVTEKIEVVDVIVRKDGAGAGNTVTVKNAATAITDAIVAATDKATTRAGTIDTAQNVIAAGGTLRVTGTRAAGTMVATVWVVCVVRP
jgi:hypothetical protein